MGIKNPTLRRRTKELTECANDARECRLVGYELKELGNLVASMASHMVDLQRKVDSQAEYIKTLNEKLAEQTEPQMKCEACKWDDKDNGCPWASMCRCEYEPTQTDCRRCKHFTTETCRDCRGGDLFKDSGYVTETEQTKPKGEE